MSWHRRRNQISSFGANGRVHLNRRGASVQSTTGSRGVRISGSNAGYTMFRGSVKSTGYTLHSPVSPLTSPPVRHRVPSHFNWSLLLMEALRRIQLLRYCDQISGIIVIQDSSSVGIIVWSIVGVSCRSIQWCSFC